MDICSGDKHTHDDIVHEEQECPLCEANELIETLSGDGERVAGDLMELITDIKNRIDASMRSVGAVLPEEQMRAQYTAIVSANIAKSWVEELERIKSKAEDIHG